MNTFDAIAQIRKQGMTRPDALKFLVERLGLNTIYADEIAAVIFGSAKASTATENRVDSASRKTA
jgi:hypothetical protein